MNYAENHHREVCDINFGGSCDCKPPAKAPEPAAPSSDPHYADWQIPMFRDLMVRWHNCKKATPPRVTDAELISKTINNLRLLYPEAYSVVYQQAQRV